MANYKKPNPKTPDERMERFLEAGGSLNEEQWSNMTKKTRRTFIEAAEKRKKNSLPAPNTKYAKKAGLKAGDEDT